MVELKLAKLPDRVPVKITVTVKPELHRLLGEYAREYQAAYGGDAETVAELIPYMLQCFIESDRGFMQALKERPRDNGAGGPSTPPAARRQRSVTSSPATPVE